MPCELILLEQTPLWKGLKVQEDFKYALPGLGEAIKCQWP